MSEDLISKVRDFSGHTFPSEPDPWKFAVKELLEEVAVALAALESENAKLRAVVEAAKELVQEHYIDATCKNCTGETNHVEQLLENLERLETTNG